MKSVAEAKEAVYRALDARRDEHIRLLQEFVRLRSTPGREKAAQQWMARQMRRVGLLVDVFDCDPTELAHLPGWTPVDRTYDDRPNVVGIRPSAGSGRSLILAAHVDTAEADPIELWTRDPWSGEVEENRLYGRGALDDKAGGVEMLMIAQALKDAGVQLAGTLTLQSAVDEENTGNGTLACVARGYDADAAVVVDGGRLGRAILSHSGQVAFRVTCYGKPISVAGAHKGINAIDRVWVIVAGLRQLEARKNENVHPLWAATEHPVNFNLWGIHGGEWLGTVPARCNIECTMSFLPPDDLTSIKREIEATVVAAAQADPWLNEHPPVVTYNALAHEPVVAQSDTEFFRTLDLAYRQVAGEPLEPMAINGWCDVRHFNLHRPTPACLFGPGRGGGAHRLDEFFNVDELGPATRTLAAFAIDWCGVG